MTSHRDGNWARVTIWLDLIWWLIQVFLRARTFDRDQTHSVRFSSTLSYFGWEEKQKPWDEARLCFVVTSVESPPQSAAEWMRNTQTDLNPRLQQHCDSLTKHIPALNPELRWGFVAPTRLVKSQQTDCGLRAAGIFQASHAALRGGCDFLLSAFQMRRQVFSLAQRLISLSRRHSTVLKRSRSSCRHCG